MRLQSSVIDSILKEAVNVTELNSGFSKDKKTIINVKKVIGGEEPVIVGSKTYMAKMPVRGTQLKKAMIVLASYNATNQGAGVYEILGVTGSDKAYGEGGIKYQSVRDMLRDHGVSSLKEAEKKTDENEYGFAPYLVVKDLNSGKEGAWFYIFHGRWCRGSGAEPLSFTLLEEVAAPVIEKPVEQQVAASKNAGLESHLESELDKLNLERETDYKIERPTKGPVQLHLRPVPRSPQPSKAQYEDIAKQLQPMFNAKYNENLDCLQFFPLSNTTKRAATDKELQWFRGELLKIKAVHNLKDFDVDEYWQAVKAGDTDKIKIIAGHLPAEVLEKITKLYETISKTAAAEVMPPKPAKPAVAQPKPSVVQPKPQVQQQPPKAEVKPAVPKKEQLSEQDSEASQSILDTLKKGLPGLVTTINLSASQMNKVYEMTGVKTAQLAYKKLVKAANLVQAALTSAGRI